MSQTITFIWYDDIVAPADFEAPVVYCSSNNKIGTLKNTYAIIGGDTSKKHSNWEWLVEKYRIKCWTYQSDLLPY